MKTLKSNRLLGKTLLALCCVSALAVATATATVLTWDLNPNAQDGPVGSDNHVFTTQGQSITAYGFDHSGTDTPHELYFKNSGTSDEEGLGLVGTVDNELHVDANFLPVNYIQLDLSSILAQGFTNGQIEVGSIQVGDSFVLYGSNTLGTLGTQIGGTYGSNFEEMFVSVPSFGSWNYVSVAAGAGDIIPIAFRATTSTVPEPSTASLMAALFAGGILYSGLRRKRSAQMEASKVS